MKNPSRTLIFCTVSAIMLQSASFSLAGVDETKNPNGTIKNAYQTFGKNHGVDPLNPSQQAANELTGQPLGDSIRILPLPLILETEEYQHIQAGAIQRARAFNALFSDIVLHKGQTLLASGLVTEQQLSDLFKVDGSYALEYLRQIWAGHSATDINYGYGPDIGRLDSGEFGVFEDNIGPIGGMGDIHATHLAFQDSVLGVRDGIAPDILLPALRQFIGTTPKEQVLVLYRETDADSKTELTEENLMGERNDMNLEDMEDRRIVQNLLALGLKIKKPSEINSADLADMGSGKVRKIINFIDISESGARPVAKDAILELFRESRIQLFTSPGVSAISNKAFLPIADRAIEIYLNEKPIIPTLPTEWVTTAPTEQQLKENWVYKQVDGNQGKEVWLTGHMNDETRLGLVQYLQEWVLYDKTQYGRPLPRFIRQRYSDQSYIPAQPGSWVQFRVDIRPLNWIVNGEPMARPVLWGRANLRMGGLKTNVSQGAMELVVTTPDLCVGALKPKR